MLQTVTSIIKRVSIPTLLVASVFSRFSANFELLVDIVICMGALIFIQRAIRAEKYLWATGIVPIVVVFSPIPPALQIFLLMGITEIFLTMLAVFRTQPLPVD
jgi:ATP/ADP translocase